MSMNVETKNKATDESLVKTSLFNLHRNSSLSILQDEFATNLQVDFRAHFECIFL